jgi:hypothetical protein
MANADRPSGLTAIGTLSGADYHGKLRRVTFAVGDAVAAFQGDLVKLTGTTDATGKIPVVAQSAAGDASIGVIASFIPIEGDEGSLTTNHKPASTAQDALIYWGQDVLYTIQEDSVTNDIEITEAGLNCNVIVGSGSTVTGISGMELDSDSAASTSTLNLRLHRVHDAPDNALGTNAEWVVSINASQEALNQTGI